MTAKQQSQRHILGRINVALEHRRSMNSLISTACQFFEGVEDRAKLEADVRSIIDDGAGNQLSPVYLSPFDWDSLVVHLQQKGHNLNAKPQN